MLANSLKDYNGAILDYNKAIELDINYASAYCNRGLTKCMLDKIDEGRLDFFKAVSFGSIEANEYLKKTAKN